MQKHFNLYENYEISNGDKLVNNFQYEIFKKKKRERNDKNQINKMVTDNHQLTVIQITFFSFQKYGYIN